MTRSRNTFDVYGRNGRVDGIKFVARGKDGRGIEKGTKTVELMVKSAQYGTSHRVVSWKEYVLPSWWRVQETTAGPILKQYERIGKKYVETESDWQQFSLNS